MQNSGVQSSDQKANLMHSGTSFGEKQEKIIKDRAFSLMMTSFKNSEAGDTEGLMQSEAIQNQLSMMGSQMIKEEAEEEEQIGLYFEDD